MRRTSIAVCSSLLTIIASAQPQSIDERPAGPGEWGFRPAVDEVVARNPPPLSWRPQNGAASYTLQIASGDDFADIAYEASDIEFNVHCPTSALNEGRSYWRFRFVDGAGDQSDWSSTRHFTVGSSAVEFPFPDRDEILSRVPDAHPRLFMRPEFVDDLHHDYLGARLPGAQELLRRCEDLLADPPPTAEPPKYESGMVRGSDPWRAVWWGNRTDTIALLDSAATLGFAWRMTGERRYGEEAKRLLLAALMWDPKGSTGYRYNDEAGMPYAYHFSRTYTFINDLLTEQERDACRRIMRIRGNEMYNHLNPRHLWQPYSSHSNRAWHFLGEVAVAFHGEIPEADDWLWFAVNVFANTYPVWSDSDGGWHEGVNYWQSYLGRFTWWADVMREALRIDAYQLPYFSKAGEYGMYMMPPGTHGGGFGDLNARMTSQRLVPLLTTLAAQSNNPHLRWYVDQQGGPNWPNDYISLLRRARTVSDAQAPTSLPSSRLFAGTGQAVLNSDLLDGKNNIQIVFKSSPFGSQSHGYEAQNSFLISAFGEPLLIRTGYRDSYGSEHHQKWMWQTKSVNSITLNGGGQIAHSQRSTGRIMRFHSSERIDYVEGEAAGAYGGTLERFTRGILFIKPDLIVIHDRLVAMEPSTFEWLLHAPSEMTIDGNTIHVHNEANACVVQFMTPHDLVISQTDQFDPPPRERIQLTEYHLTAATTEPARQVEFITVIRPHRPGDPPPATGTLEVEGGTHRLTVHLSTGLAEIRIGSASDPEAIAVLLRDAQGVVIDEWARGPS